MRVALRAWLFLCLAAAAACAGPAGAADKALPVSNLNLLDRAVTEAARTLVARSPLASGTRVALKKLPEGTISPLAQRAVLAALTERRIEVFEVRGVSLAETTASSIQVSPMDSIPTNLTIQQLNAQQRARRAQAQNETGSGDSDLAPDEANLSLLVVTVDEARVDYPRLFRSGLFGGLHVERRAIAGLSAQLLRPHTRAVYWVGAADTSLADYVRRSEVALLEDTTHPETKGTVPSQSWQKVIEPVLVIGLVVGLVSLFYTNRP